MGLFSSRNGAAAFRPEQLPQTRKAVFWDVVKLHWSQLLVMSCLVFLFSLPMHFVGLLRQISTAQALSGYEAATDAARLEMMQTVIFWKNLCALLEIPCLLIMAVCLAGLLRVVRQYAWEEPVDLMSDFFAGLRQNIGQSLGLALLAGVVNALVRWCTNAAPFQNGLMMSVAMTAPVLLAVFCGIPMAAYAAAVIPVYEGKLTNKLRVGTVLLGKNPFKTLGALLLCLLPLAVYLVPNLRVQLAARGIYSFLVPFILLGWFLFASNRLDTHIYPTAYPELVGRGLYRSKEEAPPSE